MENSSAYVSLNCAEAAARHNAICTILPPSLRRSLVECAVRLRQGRLGGSCPLEVASQVRRYGRSLLSVPHQHSISLLLCKQHKRAKQGVRGRTTLLRHNDQRRRKKLAECSAITFFPSSSVPLRPRPPSLPANVICLSPLSSSICSSCGFPSYVTCGQLRLPYTGNLVAGGKGVFKNPLTVLDGGDRLDIAPQSSCDHTFIAECHKYHHRSSSIDFSAMSLAFGCDGLKH